MKDIEKRLDLSIQISEDLYAEGLLDIIGFLFLELNIFLKEENRFIGITKSYMNTINDTFKKINLNVSSENIDIYGKILYLYKPLLKKEFKRLKSKRISSGDVTIIIISKLVDILSSIKYSEFRFHKEVKTIKKIITKFFDNIKNQKKNDSLFILSSTIKTYKSQGLIGKFPLDRFSFIDEVKVKEELQDPGERVSEESSNKLKEIIF